MKHVKDTCESVIGSDIFMLEFDWLFQIEILHHTNKIHLAFLIKKKSKATAPCVVYSIIFTPR